jgi:hypothetical protein
MDFRFHFPGSGIQFVEIFSRFTLPKSQVKFGSLFLSYPKQALALCHCSDELINATVFYCEAINCVVPQLPLFKKYVIKMD